MKILDNLDDKYKYDVYILSITFNYYKDDDLLDDNLKYPPRLIITGRSGKPHPITKKFTGYYNYFKLIFIDPSSYNIHVKTRGELDGSEDDYPTTTKPNMNYSYSVPFTFEMIETQKAPNHYKWEIYFLNNDTTEAGYIKIYADSLEVEDLDYNPVANY